MNLPRDPEQPEELVTAPVRSGRSPWLIAVVALAILGSVVYVGVTGQSSSPTRADHPASPVAVAALPPSASPSASPTSAAPSAPPAPSSTSPSPGRPDSGVPVPGPGRPYPGATAIADGSAPSTAQGFLGTGLEIDGRVTLAALADRGSGQLHAAYLVPLPAPAAAATIQLVDVNGPSERTQYGSWSVPLDTLASTSATAILVDEHRPPDSVPDPQEPRISRNGFSIQVTGEQQGSDEIVNVDVVLSPDPTFPDETYRITAEAGSKAYVGVIQHSLPGHFQGELIFPRLLDARTVVVHLNATPRGSETTTVVQSHTFDGPRTAAYATDDRSVVITSPPVVTGKGKPSIVSAGYQLTLQLTFDGPFPVVFFDVRINPVRGTLTRQVITGDDGFVGWPPSASGSMG